MLFFQRGGTEGGRNDMERLRSQWRRPSPASPPLTKPQGSLARMARMANADARDGQDALDGQLVAVGQTLSITSGSAIAA